MKHQKNMCVFCSIIKGNIPSYHLWENKDFVAFLDIHPIKPGHILVIPKKHVDNVFDLDEKTYRDLFKTAKHLARPLKRAMKSKRIGMAIEGFGVPHVHLHLVPVNKGNEMNPTNTTSPSATTLHAVAKKIMKELVKK